MWYNPIKMIRRISIHALREEGDFNKFHFYKNNFTFLSTPSARRATRKKAAANDIEVISIHALREEGDLSAGAPGKV